MEDGNLDIERLSELFQSMGMRSFSEKEKKFFEDFLDFDDDKKISFDDFEDFLQVLEEE